MGLRVGEYRGLEVLGSGQFGTVFLAENDKGQYFALKVLNLRAI